MKFDKQNLLSDQDLVKLKGGTDSGSGSYAGVADDIIIVDADQM